MPRENYHRAKCSAKNCNEVGIYTYSNQKELKSLYKKTKNWTCVRHTRPQEVLSTEDKIKTVIIMVKSKTIGEKKYNFWQKEEDFGTDRLLSAFQHGNGYKAYADDFKEGTKLKITAEIIENG